jgi:CubicO group peptidase (beta-lactamase class C family)
MPVSYSPHSAVGPVQDYGMGWNIQPYLGHHLNHVGGWIEGFVSWISFMPFEDIGVVVLCNMSDCELTYVHPGYGSIGIAVESGSLTALFRGEKMKLNHMRDNFFFTEHFLDGFNGKGLRFITNDQGRIGRIEIALQRGVKNIVFLRQ